MKNIGLGNKGRGKENGNGRYIFIRRWFNMVIVYVERNFSDEI